MNTTTKIRITYSNSRRLNTRDINSTEGTISFNSYFFFSFFLRLFVVVVFVVVVVVVGGGGGGDVCLFVVVDCATSAQNLTLFIQMCLPRNYGDSFLIQDSRRKITLLSHQRN